MFLILFWILMMVVTVLIFYSNGGDVWVRYQMYVIKSNYNKRKAKR